MTVLVISDLHLSPEQPQLIEQFRCFCAGPARAAQRLFILGDLFEVWLGDDFVPPALQVVLTALKQLSAEGTEVLVMHGNRDFLLGAEFERQSGCRLIADPTCTEIEGVPALLLHGDTLCTEDVAYQQMRQQLRQPEFIRHFLSLPIAERLAQAQALRQRSEGEKQEKTDYVMDANPQAVEQALQQYGVTTLIHGHTHRQGIHPLALAEGGGRRYVLGDWQSGPAALVCQGEAWSIEALV